MDELTDDEAVLAASGGHPFLAQLLPHRIAGPGSAWAHGGAVAVRHDYWDEPVIALAGPAGDVAALLRDLAARFPGTHVSFPTVDEPVPVQVSSGWGFGWRTAPDLGFVASLAVQPASRRRGLGESLLRWACDELVRERGRIALWYDEDNAPAIAIYERLGFTLLPMTSGDLVGDAVADFGGVSDGVSAAR